jgi:hypothetical protein
MLEGCHITCVGIPTGCDLFRIYHFIYVDLEHLVLKEISWPCWDLVNDMLVTFYLRHVLFQSYLVPS